MSFSACVEPARLATLTSAQVKRVACYNFNSGDPRRDSKCMDGSVTFYKRITIFENRKRVRTLTAFRQKAQQWAQGNRQDDAATAELRREINGALFDARKFTTFAGVGVTGQQFPAPAVGGFVVPVDLFTDIFGPNRIIGGHGRLIDSIDRAIGVYESDKGAATIRTFNPFWWIGQALSWVAKTPFMIVSAAGFDTSKIEESLTGKILRLVVWAGGAAASYVALSPYLPF